MYDESLWDELENILHWTTIDKLWDYFKCPVCWLNIDAFQWIEEETIYISDKKNLSPLELKHIPHILYIEKNKINVNIWKIKHPMEEKHFITSIMLYDEDWELIKEEFFTYSEEPEIIFDISSLSWFEIKSKCNLHWLWSTWIINN